MSAITEPNLSTESAGLTALGKPLPEPALAKPRRRSGGAFSLFAQGEPMVWLSGGALAVCLAMVTGLLVLILLRGGSTFWPLPLTRVQLIDGKTYLGEQTREETYRLTGVMYASLPEPMREVVRPRFIASRPVAGFRISKEVHLGLSPEMHGIIDPMLPADWQKTAEYVDLQDDKIDALAADVRLKVIDALIAADPDAGIIENRRLYRTGNFELMNEHFHWISDFAVKEREEPQWAALMERQEDGRFYGTPLAFLQTRPWTKDDSIEKLKAADPNATVIVNLFQGKMQNRVKLADVKPTDDIVYVVLKSWEDPKEAWAEFQDRHPAVLDRVSKSRAIDKEKNGEIRERQESAKLDMLDAKLRYTEDSDQFRDAKKRFQEVEAQGLKDSLVVADEIRELQRLNREYGLFLLAADGRTRHLEMDNIVRTYLANQITSGDKFNIYLSRWWEFLTADPRNVNLEGGVFPAIYGTVVMTLIMSFLVVPFGVLAALYLREYAKAGPIVSAVRIAVNNLAGVPSIVFGVFGLGFFCYKVGAFIDGGSKHAFGIEPLSGGAWSGLLVVLVLCVAGAIMISIQSSVSKARGSDRTRWMGNVAALLWVAAVVTLVLLVVLTPFFEGFFRAKLVDNKPTFGTGGLLWASLTLALLTLPVVIVATEEALSAVPSSMREGSYGCGASKWQTIRRIVLPRAMPGIMTGTILAMARGAGEVAPLMLVGVMKLVPELPVDGHFPFIHAERSFMHLGFHIYDVGFQSPNSKAAESLVFTTTLLLIVIIAVLNILAITLRSRLRRKFVSGQF